MTTLASKPLNIRRAARGDLAAMLRIEQASVADPWTVESLATALSLDRMQVLVAESGELRGQGGDAGSGLLGYVVALVAGTEAEIADLAVAPEARRLGIGRALLQRILSELREAAVQTV